MTKEQYIAIRRRFFPNDPTAFLLEMGYGGDGGISAMHTVRNRARKFESGRLPIPRNVARFAWLLDQWRLQGGDVDELPQWPDEDM